MTHGAPDWTRKVELVIVEGQPSTERAWGDTGRYSGSATSYQTVASATVATGYVGELKEIILISDTFASTTWKITIGDVVWATDWVHQSTMPLIFEDLRLAAGKTVTVECKSDGAAIVVDVVIVGKEVAV